MTDPILEFEPVIAAAAHLHGLEPALVYAVISKESGGNPLALRYEPGFHHLLDAETWARRLNASEATEIAGQKFSWGLMQVMGATARELGFGGYFPALCTPELGIRYGCLYLKKQFIRYDGEMSPAVAAYNAGTARLLGAKYSNQPYVDDVLGRYWKKKSAVKL